MANDSKSWTYFRSSRIPFWGLAMRFPKDFLQIFPVLFLPVLGLLGVYYRFHFSNLDFFKEAIYSKEN